MFRVPSGRKVPHDKTINIQFPLVETRILKCKYVSKYVAGLINLVCHAVECVDCRDFFSTKYTLAVDNFCKFARRKVTPPEHTRFSCRYMPLTVLSVHWYQAFRGTRANPSRGPFTSLWWSGAVFILLEMWFSLLSIFFGCSGENYEAQPCETRVGVPCIAVSCSDCSGR